MHLAAGNRLLYAVVVVGFVAAELVLAEDAASPRRHQRSNSAPPEPENAFKEFLDAVNPAYLIIIGCLIAAGCAFELAYGTRGSSGRTDWSHVASRQQPYSVTTA
uniref:Uncharacterized protein n=1 Tax=Panagrellus redivivus TaxID=6233 RepID=A0A7E4VWJ4_PANRE